jgi:hypothetical protein
MFSLKEAGKFIHTSITGSVRSAKVMDMGNYQRGKYIVDKIRIDKNEYQTGLTASIDNNMLGTNHNQLTAFFAIKRSKTVKSLYYSSVTRASRDAMETTIKYAEGNNGLLNGADQSDNISSSDEKQVEGLGVAGFAVGIAGIFVLGWLFGFIGVIFGIISLVRMKKNPDMYKGKWYAIGSLILGIVDITVVLILLL